MHKVWHRTNTSKFGHFDHVMVMHGKHQVSVEVPHLMHNLYSFTVGVVWVVIAHCIS